MASGSIWKNQNILVTGGQGFLGSHLVAELKRRGATDITIPEYPKVDLTKLEDCRRVVKGQDIIMRDGPWGRFLKNLGRWRSLDERRNERF